MRKEERPVMSFANTHTKFEIVSTTTQNINFSPKMLMVQFFIPPGSEDSEDYLTHTAEELIVLIQGKLEVTYGDSVYQLESGDSIYVQENIPHRIVNISEEEAIGYYVVTPPSIPKHES